VPCVASGGRGPPGQYRDFVPDVTSTDAGDAATAAEPLAVSADARPATGEPDGSPGRDPWTVTSVVVTAVLIAACVAGALAAIVPSRTEIPGLPNAGTITALLLPAVKAMFDLSAALTVGWLLAAAWLAPPQRNGLERRRWTPSAPGLPSSIACTACRRRSARIWAPGWRVR